jgi:poly(hydroxyalkanoate) depolymerase family esterase
MDLKIFDAFRDRLRVRPLLQNRSRETPALAPSIADTIHTALAAAGLMRNGPVVRQRDAQWREATTPGVAGPRLKPARPVAAPRKQHAIEPGAFLSRAFTDGVASLAYKLYVPSTYSAHGQEVPLIVMLHGCTQSPDDFAAGTRMNQLAEDHGFLVAYPAQAPRANGSKCWNWFMPSDQRRDEGEPSLIAGIAREVVGAYRIDQRRIFVAGLSAGAAMAVVLGTTYPDLFAGVGAHSGLAYGMAHDVPSAFQVMRDASAGTSQSPRQDRVCQVPIGVTIPMILFHGDCDSTVDSRNGAALVAQTLAAFSGGSAVPTGASEMTIAGGLSCMRTVYSLGTKTIVEDWLIHGAGHAWSGGSTAGSFTEPTGPNASGEMVRFFLA